MYRVEGLALSTDKHEYVVRLIYERMMYSFQKSISFAYIKHF